ncbi:hypothetical protein SAMN06296036_11030 [Pseudobacteriovorax antillogorgiicola]|uniref:Uncharacterized protein n=1 Tax=Pseudobacteriovorax antillogorgiicola TaxID=1513793 RepID=A0A1Y6BWI2_9BACT|nr:hypothetical protein EDD56_11331 [Pseudobacteriovorax antillogorgiicola]SMF32459.1 hypothetical protein SAMN06296036_11030 [Pseudobacteriovorax antillogorgiicola]
MSKAASKKKNEVIEAKPATAKKKASKPKAKKKKKAN